MGKLSQRELRERTISILQEKGGSTDLEEILKKSPTTLAKAFQIRNTFDLEHLDNLLKRSFDNPVISLYLTFSGKNTYRTDKIYLTEFNSLMKEEIKEKKKYIDKLPTKQKESVRKDLKDIESFLVKLKSITKDKIKSLVIFKSNKDLNLVLTFLTNLHIKNSLSIDPDPYITPLLEVLKIHGTYLMVRVEANYAVFYINQLGNVIPLKKIKIKGGFQKANIKSAGVPGKAQRDRRNQIHLFYKEIANNINSFIYSNNYKGLFLMGDRQTVKKFREYLSKEAQELFLKNIITSPTTTLKEIRKKVDEVIKNKEKKEEREALAKLQEAINKGLAVEGIGAVAEAQNRFLTKEIFLLENAQIRGFACPKHNYLSTKEGFCPFCNKDLKPVKNLYEEVAEIARKYKTPVHIITFFNKKMKKLGEAAAILYSLK